jgi:hypothetical protein
MSPSNAAREGDVVGVADRRQDVVHRDGRPEAGDSGHDRGHSQSEHRLEHDHPPCSALSAGVVDGEVDPGGGSSTMDFGTAEQLQLQHARRTLTSYPW